MNDKKKKKKLGWKGILFAIIVVIIAIILFSWHGFDFGGFGGSNNGKTQESSDQSDTSGTNTDEEDKNPSGVSDDSGEAGVLSVVVDGNSLFYTMNYEANEGLLETDKEAMSTLIDEESITQVDLYDRGAVKKTYDEIYQLLTDKGLSVVEKKE